jgi:membrane protein involved in colicin uptake
MGEQRKNMMAVIDRRVAKRAETGAARAHADAASEIALALARTNKAEVEAAAAIERARLADKRAHAAEHEAALKTKRALRKLQEELAATRADNFSLRVENEKLVADVARVRGELSRLIAAHGNIFVPRRARGNGAGRGRRHSNALRKVYMKLLTLFVPPNSLNEVFATVACAIAGDFLEREGMELPDDAFCRGLRAELAAVHRLTCGLAFAKAMRIR